MASPPNWFHSTKYTTNLNSPPTHVQVQITTITNQNWQLPKSRGTIVASNDQYLAYVLEGKSGYVLRVLQPETSNRALLKGFVGGVLDVAFAHRGSSLLAAVDEGGNVYVWDLSRVEEITKAPTYPMTMLFYIQRLSRSIIFNLET